jgi:molybdopterin-guanine dinucleotide biosynthesis protein A
MALRAASIQGKAVVLGDTDGPRPLPAVVTVAPALALARKLLETGERRLRALVDGLGMEVLAEAIWTGADERGAWRDDVNEPGDLPRKGR